MYPTQNSYAIKTKIISISANTQYRQTINEWRSWFHVRDVSATYNFNHEHKMSTAHSKAVVMVSRLGGQDILLENYWVGKTYYFLDFALYVWIIGWAAAHPMTTPLAHSISWWAQNERRKLLKKKMRFSLKNLWSIDSKYNFSYNSRAQKERRRFPWALTRAPLTAQKMSACMSAAHYFGKERRVSGAHVDD